MPSFRRLRVQILAVVENPCQRLGKIQHLHPRGILGFWIWLTLCYQHLDYESLEKNVIASNADKKIIIADSVFSMTGERYDLEKLSRIAKKYGCLLFVDDAHGFGVTREDGRLFPSSLNGIRKDKVKIDAYIGTFGKAIGTFGAFVCGSKSLIELLVQKSKPYIYYS